MTSVCSVGLDMVLIPGDTPAETIAAIIADEMAIGVINNKTTGRAAGAGAAAKAGDVVDFGGLRLIAGARRPQRRGERPVCPFRRPYPRALQSLGN